MKTPEVDSGQISRNEFEMDTFDLTSFVSKAQGCVSISHVMLILRRDRKTTRIHFLPNST
jgi:hypothetical protein